MAPSRHKEFNSLCRDGATFFLTILNEMKGDTSQNIFSSPNGQ